MGVLLCGCEPFAVYLCGSMGCEYLGMVEVGTVGLEICGCVELGEFKRLLRGD